MKPRSKVSRKAEAEAARLKGLTRFLPTRRCPHHSDSEFYTSAVLCVACQQGFKNSDVAIAKRAIYWEANKHKYNRQKKDVTHALNKLINLIHSGVEYPDAEFRVVKALGVNAGELRAAYDKSCE